MGVSTDDVEFLENAIVEFDEIRAEIDDINADVKEIIYSVGGTISDEFLNDVYEIETGQKSFDDVKVTIERMRQYRDNLQASFDPSQIEY